MKYYQMDKELLTVNNDQDLDHLYGQALDIAGYTRNLTNDKAFICMMHTPQEAQLADLEQQHQALDMPVALVGGQLGLMTQLIPCLVREGYAVFEAKTNRISQERTQEDGTVKRVSVFQHAGLRRLGVLNRSE